MLVAISQYQPLLRAKLVGAPASGTGPPELGCAPRSDTGPPELGCDSSPERLVGASSESGFPSSNPRNSNFFPNNRSGFCNAGFLSPSPIWICSSELSQGDVGSVLLQSCNALATRFYFRGKMMILCNLLSASSFK